MGQIENIPDRDRLLPKDPSKDPDRITITDYPNRDHPQLHIPLDKLLNRSLSNDRDEYTGIHYMDGASMTSASLASKYIVTDIDQDTILSGSVVSGFYGRSSEHMSSRSDFLGWMQWLYNRPVNPHLLNSGISALGEYEPVVTNHLITAFYSGALNFQAMSESTYSFWRLVQKWGGPNGDIIRRTAVPNIHDALTLLRDLIAINLTQSPYNKAASISVIKYGDHELIHLHPFFTISKGLNIVLKPFGAFDSYAHITTLREAQSGLVSYEDPNNPIVTIDPNKFKQPNSMLLTPKTVYDWTLFAVKSARTMIVSEAPKENIDIDSFLEHRPEKIGDPSQEILANITANAVHARDISNTKLKYHLSRLGLSDQFHHNKVSEVRDFVISALQELCPGSIHSIASEFLDSLINGIAEYLMVPLEEYIELTPPPEKRDQVDARFVFPTAPGTTRPLPKDTKEILTRVTQLPNFPAVDPQIQAKIKSDIQNLSRT
jgi:hypothetical protein